MFKLFRTTEFYGLKSQFHSSITSFTSSSKITATPSTNFVVDYLINSLGFLEHDAIAASSEVPQLRSAANFHLVVNVFKDYGLDDVQIRSIVSIVPKVLTIRPNETLEPKLRIFRELGLAGPDLVTLVKKNRFIFWKGLDTQIIPTVNYLRSLLGCDEKVVEMINRSKWMPLTSSIILRISGNIDVLKKYGLSDDKILKFLVKHPQIMKQTPGLVERKLQFIEQKLGISRNLPIFIHGLLAVMYSSEPEIEKKRHVFRSFGWSDDEIATLIRAQPYCLSKSETNISDLLKFFMKDLEYIPSYIMRCTCFWTLSLEKRMKPRNDVLKILKEKELVKEKPSFITVVQYPELKFLGFLKKFESQIPNLCETYNNSIKNSKP